MHRPTTALGMEKVHLDVANKESIQTAIEQIVEKAGRIGRLHANPPRTCELQHVNSTPRARRSVPDSILTHQPHSLHAYRYPRQQRCHSLCWRHRGRRLGPSPARHRNQRHRRSGHESGRHPTHGCPGGWQDRQHRVHRWVSAIAVGWCVWWFGIALTIGPWIWFYVKLRVRVMTKTKLFSIARSPLGIYSMTKAALSSFSDTMRIEVKPFNIDVIVVTPGKLAEIRLSHEGWPNLCHSISPSSPPLVHLAGAIKSHIDVSGAKETSLPLSTCPIYREFPNHHFHLTATTFPNSSDSLYTSIADRIRARGSISQGDADGRLRAPHRRRRPAELAASLLHLRPFGHTTSLAVAAAAMDHRLFAGVALWCE
ncbi:hypothetical protein BC938DRAFT_472875 [Jimgerdemannia flammicorona]|uniref:Uncharacterized protein n=1 Tax=Jimgerdemannia flammicorona TaxID=994334 RepID=A0A433Q588_9FUNG|nr:hypothetical protein BC938DRAFT_472875 [Jimgerdemannia flammicorona]